jgi:prepilin-type N-terminal cleavage/methylation domain-containing protein
MLRSAFSLVELSIVLVILGLLTGGILTGQSLIRAAELRSISADYQRYLAASNTFRDKYFALPGDMPNATRFWGDDNAACADAAIPNGTPGTCNGNGDALVATALAVNSTGEALQFWKQLALAGLIEGNFTGLSGSGGLQDSIIGVNVPASKISNGGWSIYSFPSMSLNPVGWANFEGTYGNTLVFGSKLGNSITEGAILRAEETWNIDTKMDDGRPGTGRLRVYEAFTNCHDAGTSTTVALAGIANYDLDNTAIGCSLLFDMK